MGLADVAQHNRRKDESRENAKDEKLKFLFIMTAAQKPKFTFQSSFIRVCADLELEHVLGEITGERRAGDWGENIS